MSQIDMPGMTYKVEISQHDIYLQIGTVTENIAHEYPHLEIGEPCYWQVALSKSGESMRVYRVLFDLANKAIKAGISPKEIAEFLRFQSFEPSGWYTHGGGGGFARSICDVVAKIILDNYYSKNNNEPNDKGDT